MKIKNLFLSFVFSFSTILVLAQPTFDWKQSFTHADTLRGALRTERTCYDVTFYDLAVDVDIEKKYLKGQCEIQFIVNQDFTTFQIDLFTIMKINKITFLGKNVDYKREENAVFITLPQQLKGTKGAVIIDYEGHPLVAKNAPWDGGFAWKKDRNGKPWVGVACEGLGASSWWPCKDHLSDEPDSMSIKVTCPSELFCVCNGNLRKKEVLTDGKTRFDWFVSYPINSYNVTLNIADYYRLSDVYTSKKDNTKLDLEFYCLSYNIDKAKKQFQQVKPMLEAYENYFDKYPFWKDGYCLVETSYLGMEHQGAIAYGNQYMRGYLGGMIPKDMNWDYIIIHETGHEYFGNSISCNDHAEMWIHESFTTYMEALYVEYTMSYPDAVRYLMNQRDGIYNMNPIVGPKDVNFDGWEGSDMYYKGAWILHTLRNAIDDDKVFFGILKGFYQKNTIRNVKTEDFINYVNTATKKDFTAFFHQYLYVPQVPIFQYKIEKKSRKDICVYYKWKAEVENFDMPIKIGNPANFQTVTPSTKEWKKVILKNTSEKDFDIATQLFLIEKDQVSKID
jgi:aminopeptidase N